MAKKETFLSKIRGDSSISLNEEEMLRKELLDLKMSLASGQLKEIHKIKEIMSRNPETEGQINLLRPRP